MAQMKSCRDLVKNCKRRNSFCVFFLSLNWVLSQCFQIISDRVFRLVIGLCGSFWSDIFMPFIPFNPNLPNRQACSQTLNRKPMDNMDRHYLNLGRDILKLVPRPSLLSMVILPWCFSTISLVSSKP